MRCFPCIHETQRLFHSQKIYAISIYLFVCVTIACQGAIVSLASYLKKKSETLFINDVSN